MIMKPISGAVLLERGFTGGEWFSRAIPEAERLRATGADWDTIDAAMRQLQPPPPIALREVSQRAGYTLNIREEMEGDAHNIEKVTAHMEELMRVPTVVYGTVLPDACPSGKEPGTIPVGGVVATREAIHPGFHSADICCSVAITVFRSLPRDPDDVGPAIDEKFLLDIAQRTTHFGGGGRKPGEQWRVGQGLMDKFKANPWTKPLRNAAVQHFGTQGDGNHFLYVGRLKEKPEYICLVTHHGSRAPGALLYKAGMAYAQKVTRRISPETPKHNAWIPSETAEGESYWAALQLIREWTKRNHFAIHDAIKDQQSGLVVVDRFWNEHNFVFRKSDGLFYHAKGATPGFADWAHDATGATIVPLNMCQPILITEGSDNPASLGFLPHGAGRNMSRSNFMRENLVNKTAQELFAEQTVGIDARSWCGHVDVSELPGAYKDADSVRRQIEHFGLAHVVGEVMPYGSIMAGDWQADAPWRTRGAMHRKESVDPV